MTKDWIDTGLTQDGCEEPFERKVAGVLLEQLNDYLYRYPSETLVVDNNLLTLVGLPTIPKRRLTSAEIGQEEAERFFVRFVSCQWKVKVGWCKRCREFFFVEHRKPRKLYKRGWYCDRCKHAATAERSTARLREESRNLKLAVASHALNGSPTANAKQIEAMMKADSRLGSVTISDNWVTRNMAEIREKIADLR